MVDLEHLRVHGYVVVEGVIEPPRLDALIEVLRAHAGLDADDASTWDWGSFSPPVWGHQAQWDIRQDPEIHAVFAEIYGQQELIVSQDGMSFKPPVQVAATRVARALPIHWDFPPDDPRRIFQGLLYVSDVAEDQGAFCCVPGVFGDLEGWLERHPQYDMQSVDLEGHPIVPVPGRAGDLVVFNGHLPHGNGDNHAERPRVAQYISMWPPDFWGLDRSHYAELYRSGMPEPGLRGRPGWDRPQPWPPARLSPLGRRLAGLDAWE